MSKTIIIGVQPNLTNRQTDLLRQQLEQYTEGYNLVLASGVVGGIVLEGKEYETKVIEPKVETKSIINNKPSSRK